MRQNKGINILTIKKYLISLFTVVVLFLGGCSDESSDGPSVSNNTMSAPLPKELLKVLNLDENNLLVQVVVDGGTPKTCGNLTVNTGAGTYSCSVALPAGNHTLTLIYSVIGTSYGTVQVATTSGIAVNVVVDQTSSADFSTATVTFDDDDSDGISNLDELDEGSDPTVTSYYIGGTVAGLVGTGAVLQIDVGDNLALTGDGSFNFIPAVADTTSYTVTVLTPPGSPTQRCTVTDGTGTVSSANVTTVQIICSCILGSSTIGNCSL